MRNIFVWWRELRTDKDLTQKKLAEIIGVSQQQYHKYENGVNPMPLTALIRLADYYNVSVDFLLERTQSRTGLEALNREITADCSAGELLDALLGMSMEDRRDVVKYVRLLKNKKS